MTDEIVQFARQSGVIAVRIEPAIQYDAELATKLRRHGLRRTLAWSAEHVVIVDIAGAEDELFQSFSKRARRDIRRASRDGVIVECVEPTEENCQLKYRLLLATADQRFSIPPYESARAIWQQMYAAGNGQMFSRKRVKIQWRAPLSSDSVSKRHIRPEGRQG